MSRKTVIYLASPMRKGMWRDNVRTSAKVGRDLMRKGYAVINPMGSWLLDLAEPTEFEDWMKNDYGLIAVCDGLYRIPGESEGCDLEMDFAVRHGVSVFTDLADLYKDMPTQIGEEELDLPEQPVDMDDRDLVRIDKVTIKPKEDTKKLETLKYRP